MDMSRTDSNSTRRGVAGVICIWVIDVIKEIGEVGARMKIHTIATNIMIIIIIIIIIITIIMIRKIIISIVVGAGRDLRVGRQGEGDGVGQRRASPNKVTLIRRASGSAVRDR
jgi:hypothetical protein